MLTRNGAVKGRLPNLLIIGAMKCGTTSLHYYLSLHPQIRMSSVKELNFFIQERNWSKGVSWYASHFVGEARVYGESSPNYTAFPEYQGVAERIAAVVPQAKLIYIVRDPIERLVSHYMHRVAEGREERPFGEVLADLTENPYVQRSCYYMQLEQYVRYFPLARILLLTQEDLHRKRRETLATVFRFLGVEETFVNAGFHRRYHRSDDKRRKTPVGRWLSRHFPFRWLQRLPESPRWHAERMLYWPFSRKIERPTIDADVRRRLVAALREDGRRLQAFAGRSFPHWSV